MLQAHHKVLVQYFIFSVLFPQALHVLFATLCSPLHTVMKTESHNSRLLGQCDGHQEKELAQTAPTSIVQTCL